MSADDLWCFLAIRVSVSSCMATGIKFNGGSPALLTQAVKQRWEVQRHVCTHCFAATAELLQRWSASPLLPQG